MLEDKDKEKTPVDDKDKEKEKEKETPEEEDEFSDLFDNKEDEQEEDQELEEEPKEDKIKKKKAPEKKQDPDVEKIVNEQVQSVEKRLERRADVTDFFATERGKMFIKYRDAIAKAAIDTRFVNIPVSKLPQLILKDTVYERVLNDARKKADEEAEDSIIGGSTIKSMTPEELTKIDPSTISKDEFQKLKARALRGEFKIKSK